MIRSKILYVATGVALGVAGSLFFTSRASAPAPLSAPVVASAAPAPLPTIPEVRPKARPAHYTKAADIVAFGRPQQLAIRSDAALVMDDREHVILYGHNVDEPHPIASLTKLMTALVTVEAGLPLDERVTILRADRDRLRGSGSRLPFGAVFTRYDLLQAALGASDNRAAAALGRTYPGGTEVFVAAMNAQAQKLGMMHTHYADASGLDSRDVSTARDLAKLVTAVRRYALLRKLTTAGAFTITNLKSHRRMAFFNTNRFLRNRAWDIGLSKTGYTSDAGNCLIMQAMIGERPVTIVLLDSWGKLTKYGDANRIRTWLLRTEHRIPRLTASRSAQG